MNTIRISCTVALLSLSLFANSATANYNVTSGAGIDGFNLYAPEMVWGGGNWVCYYGGWQDPGIHDKVYIRISKSGDLSQGWNSAGIVIDNGQYDHANDPSIAQFGTLRALAYTVASNSNQADGIDDWIAISFNDTGNYVYGWIPSVAHSDYEVRITNRNFSDIARPSLVNVNGEAYMFFDGKMNNDQLTLATYRARYVGAEGNHMKFEVDVELGQTSPGSGFPKYHEPDVEYVAPYWVMAYQRNFANINIAYSLDGITWTYWFEALNSSQSGTRDMISNPGMLIRDGWIHGVGCGTSGTTLMDHDIIFAE